MYGDQTGEIVCGSWGLKGQHKIQALQLFPVVCCNEWQGWTWIETWKNYAMPIKITKKIMAFAFQALQLFPVICCNEWQGWTWIETWKNYAMPTKITKKIMVFAPR